MRDPDTDTASQIQWFCRVVRKNQNNGRSMYNAFKESIEYLTRNGYEVPRLLRWPGRVISIENEDVREFGFKDTKQVSELALEALLERPEVERLVILHGCPASGKSTISRSLADGKSVVFDSPNLREDDRRRLVGLGRKHGCLVECVCIVTPLAEIRRRNSERGPDERVPDAFLERAYAESMRKPSKDEGFSRIRIVQGV